MKRKWEEPKIKINEFAANEYVAACWYFSGTEIVITQERPGTDGRKDTPSSWQGPDKGFSDDGWDFLTKGGDEDKTPGGSGWYATISNPSFIHPNSTNKLPTKYGGGPWGNDYLFKRGYTDDLATPVYYYGGGPYKVDASNCGSLGVGSNAS